MQAQDPLAQLRDIHLPDPVSAWPPAPGWWLLAALVTTLVAVAAVWLYRRYRNNGYRRLALKALTQLKAQTNSNTLDKDQQCLQQLNSLLKQTALAANAGPDVASLSGKHWLQFLDNSAKTKDFSEGVGHILLDGPYRASTQTVDFDPLFQLTQRWIKRHRIPC